MTISLDELHRAIGRVVYEWAHLENYVRTFVFDLSAVKSRQFYEDAGVKQVENIVLSNMDLRMSISICKALAFTVSEPKDFFARVERVLNTVGNDLRNRRNRFVHDRWVIWGEKIVRVQDGSNFTRTPKSGEVLFAHSRAEEFATIDELDAFADEIQDYRDELASFQEEAQELYRQKFPEEE